jgi:hypothetical protein
MRLLLALATGAAALVAPTQRALPKTVRHFNFGDFGKSKDYASAQEKIRSFDTTKTVETAKYGKRAIRATQLNGQNVLNPEPACAAFVAFAAFECYLSAQACAGKSSGDICPISTIRDWNPDFVTGGVFLFVCAVWLNWYGTFRRLAIDERGIEVVSCSSPRRDPTEEDIDTVPKSWAWGGPDRVEFKDVDDWAILPVVPVLYVREVARTASGSTRQVPYFYAPSFDTKTVEQLFESYGVPQADPEDSVLGKGSQYGAAGVLSYIAWEWAFWIGSFGIAALLFNLYEGHLPDLRFAASLDFNLPLNHIDLLQTKSGMVSIDLPSFPLQFTAQNGGDFANIAASAFVIVNLARLILPLRLALALATAPFFQETVVAPFNKLTGKAE